MPKKVQKTPDWLNPNADAGQPVQQEQEQRRKPRRGEDEDEGVGKKQKGIRWGPLVLLVLIIMPAMLPTLLDVCGKLQTMGILSIPDVSKWANGNKYRPCLQDFYADWAPEKLGQLDSTLAKYEGREKQLFATLGKKYGKKASYAKCT